MHLRSNRPTSQQPTSPPALASKVVMISRDELAERHATSRRRLEQVHQFAGKESQLASQGSRSGRLRAKLKCLSDADDEATQVNPTKPNERRRTSRWLAKFKMGRLTIVQCNSCDP